MKARIKAKHADPADLIDSWCQVQGWPVPIREHAFAAPVRDWRFDLAWPSLMIAVEIDGGAWSGGRHTRGAGFIGDIEKLNEATVRGWSVLRTTPQMVRGGAWLYMLERMLRRGTQRYGT